MWPIRPRPLSLPRPERFASTRFEEAARRGPHATIMTRSRLEVRNHRRGTTVVETAVVANLLFLILLGVFEYGRVAMIRELMDEAAREGARLAVVSTSTYPATTTQQIIDTANGYLAGQSVNNLNIQVYAADAVTGANIGSWQQAPFGAL